MIADWDTDTVLISDLLHQRYPKIERELRRILQKHDVPMLTVRGTQDIWIRDYAPLQIQRGQFLQFRYHPDYLLERHEHTITKPSVFRSLPFIRERRHSRLILDGGNVVATSRTAILTKKIVAENPTLTESQIQTRLTEKLNVVTQAQAETRAKLAEAQSDLAKVTQNLAQANWKSSATGLYFTKPSFGFTENCILIHGPVFETSLIQRT